MTDDAVTEAEATLDLPNEETFNIVRLSEQIKLGQRVDAAAIDAWDGTQWKQIASCTSIGPRRFILLAKPVRRKACSPEN